MKVLSDRCSLFVNLTGIIDIAQEIARLGKEIDRLNPQIEQYRKKMAAPGYETKVPVEVQAINSEKLAAYEAELEAVRTAIVAFEAMR